MDRKQAYEIIKSQNLQKYISEKFGKPYSSVSTDDLVSFINETINTNVSKATKLEKKSKTKKEVEKKEPKMCGLLNLDYFSITNTKRLYEDYLKNWENKAEELNEKITVNSILGGNNNDLKEQLKTLGTSISNVKKQINDYNIRLSEYEVKIFQILDYADNRFPMQLNSVGYEVSDELFTKLIRTIFKTFPTDRYHNDRVDINFAEYGVTVFLGNAIVDNLHIYFGDEDENLKWCEITINGKDIRNLLDKGEYYSLISPNYVEKQKKLMYMDNSINYRYFGNMAVLRDPEKELRLYSFDVVYDYVSVEGKKLKWCPDIKHYYWLLKLLGVTL